MIPVPTDNTALFEWDQAQLDLIPIGICVCDVSGRMRQYNRHAAELWGGRPLLDDDGYCEPIWPPLMAGRPLPAPAAPTAEVLRTGRAQRNVEVVIERPDDSHVVVLANIDPVRDESGTLVGAVNTFQDVTERLQAEQALRDSERALKEADRRKSEFLALLGHELRNPLAAVINGLEILRTVGGQDQRIRQVGRIVERQAKQMKRLIDDLLDVTRISRGKIVLRQERLDLVEEIRNAADDQRPLLKESGCELELQLPAAPVWVSADPTRLSQILVNLLHNACKFTQEGGRITVTACSETEPPAGVLQVRDTGIGMSPETLAGIFEPFTQARSNLDRCGGGLGLGLALIKGLVELHGGTISAESPGVDCGSQFIVRLPAAGGEPAQTPVEQPEAGAARPAKFRILLVEDSAPVAQIFTIMLQQMGHEVRAVSSGQAALEFIPAYRPEIVFSDISMPGMSGYELARRLREPDSPASGLVLVAMTGFGQPEDRQRALEAGFDYHLVKPAEFEELHALFHTIAARDSD